MLRGSLRSNPPELLSQLSALGVPESFDVLDAHWRLAFGKTRRLVTLSTVTGPSTLSLVAAPNRAEFESRLSALADLIDRLSVDDDLLPAGVAAETEKGSLNRLESSLKNKLSVEEHASISQAVQILRLCRQIAMRHSTAQLKAGLLSAWPPLV